MSHRNHGQWIWALAATATLAAQGCSGAGEPPGEAEPVGERADRYSFGACFHGMTTTVKAIDPAAPRCAVGELNQLTDYVCSPAGSPVTCNFLLAQVAGHALVQCSPDVAADGTVTWCADVVDHYLDGTPLDNGSTKNYFIAYADDDQAPLSPEVAHWDAGLSVPWMTDPPVELAVAGYLTKQGGLVKLWEPPPPLPLRSQRLFKFDPRNCAGCAPYKGPNFDKIETVGDLWSWWYPGFDDARCEFEVSSDGHWVLLGWEDCKAEMMYRDTGR